MSCIWRWSHSFQQTLQISPWILLPKSSLKGGAANWGRFSPQRAHGMVDTSPTVSFLDLDLWLLLVLRATSYNRLYGGKITHRSG
jgi:hypothetical protein